MPHGLEELGVLIFLFFFLREHSDVTSHSAVFYTWW